MSFHRAAFSCALAASIACSPVFRKSTAEGPAPTHCTLSKTKIECGGPQVELSRSVGIVAMPELTAELRRVLQLGSSSLLIVASLESRVKDLTRAILSAQDAGFSEVFIELDGKGLEITLPDSESRPPLQMADVYLRFTPEELVVFRSFDEFASSSGAQTKGSGTETGILRLRVLCGRAGSCKNSVISLSPEARVGLLRPVLVELQTLPSAGRSFRLVLDESAPFFTPSGEAGHLRFAPAEIRNAIERERASLKDCHHQGKEGVEALGGTLTIRFTLTRLGIVFDAEVESSQSTITDPEIQACVLERVTKIRFPKPEGKDETMLYTLRF